MSKETTSDRIENLEPTGVWKLFAGLAATPRSSGKEGKVREHVKKLAAKNGLASREDEIGNIVIDVPASAGCENAPITVLQAHLDMVCVKAGGVERDFDRDPILPVVDVDADGRRIVRAEGTTLGADNGIGIAMGLAAAMSPDVVHGPLELLFTVDEEDGMTGAKALTPESFHGRRMLNLDSEEDDALYIGCAGGRDTTLTWTFTETAPAPESQSVRIVVEGLRGGHSGGDIHENRGNAIKLLARTLLRSGSGRLQLVSITGGIKRNVIPSVASAVVSCPADVEARLREAAGRVALEGRRESAEPSLEIRVELCADGDPQAAMTPADTSTLLLTLAALPQGVLGMIPDVGDLVQTSNNVATIVSSPDLAAKKIDVEVGTLARSSSESCKDAACEQIASVGRLAGAEVVSANDYPGWEPNLDSPVLATCRGVYEKLFGEVPKVTAIHAGLECGLIGKIVGDMDMISFGPTITGAHSPEERVYVDSVAKSWKYLTAVLAELAGR